MTSSTGMDQPDPRAHRYLVMVMVMVMVTPGYTGTSPGRTGRQTSRSRRTWTCTQGRRAPRTSWSAAGSASSGALACLCWSHSWGGTYGGQPGWGETNIRNTIYSNKKYGPLERVLHVFWWQFSPPFPGIQSWTSYQELSVACPWRTWRLQNWKVWPKEAAKLFSNILRKKEKINLNLLISIQQSWIAVSRSNDSKFFFK